MTRAQSIWLFRKIASIEGWSYVLLLFVAMPLKYWAGMPEAVRMVGMVHGVLFVGYMMALGLAAERGGLSALRVTWAVVVSLVPLGTFFHDPWLKRDQDAVGQVDPAA
ncbi:DUF3817 domain-containing protein [Aliiroseovarius sp.]|uniref:DUF3817 domain-containing protein n=1 Tax=Aliiroseovarius sp. TaxID=1872442 RepID=UPI003BAB9B62